MPDWAKTTKKNVRPIPQMKRMGENKSGRIPHQRVEVNGIVFDSKSEHDRYLELLILERAGVITGLECHPVYELIPTQKVPGKRAFRGHKYTADFRYIRDGETIVEDVKSEKTREERDYIINRKLMWMLLGIYVEEVVR
jgi:hypothetical protein